MEINTENGKWLANKHGLYPVCPDVNSRNLGYPSNLGRIHKIFADKINVDEISGKALNNYVTKNDIISASVIDPDVVVKFVNIQGMPHFLERHEKADSCIIADTAQHVKYDNIENVPDFLLAKNKAESAKVADVANSVEFDNIHNVPDFVSADEFNLLNDVVHSLVNSICKIKEDVCKVKYPKVTIITKNYKISDADHESILLVKANKDITITRNSKISEGFNAVVINDSDITVEFVGYFETKHQFSDITQNKAAVNLFYADNNMYILGELSV